MSIIFLIAVFIIGCLGCYFKGKSEGRGELSFEVNEAVDDWCAENRRNRVLEKDRNYETLCDKILDVVEEHK